MKYKKTIVALSLVLAFLAWREWDYSRSPQGRLDKIIASGKESFQLYDILGGEWKAICLLPAVPYANYYPPTEGMSVELETFEAWLEGVLGRKVIPWRDWGDVAFTEATFVKVLTDKEEFENFLNHAPWMHEEGLSVKCTKNLKSEVFIERGENGPVFRFRAEHEFPLNKF